MNCDKCDKPAMVHEVTIKHGKRKEIHLCAEHAAEAGFVVHQADAPIEHLLKQFVVAHSSSAAVTTTSTGSKKCGECGLTFAQFRKNAILGCPKCYEAFVDELGPLIERAQRGATHHVDKTPRRTGAGLDRQRELQRLLKELDRAIAAEQYERAAEIRDRLNALEPAEESQG